ncbi:hypothetical protein [Undibacterium umbellatum]|uniref:PD-(D/E)XK endonuclease-like domain-containing protein n=1 Tax=Undibacterium umbellatum TaxID=2762300 RepID=A0ABR6Z388_9BURK|nr:hypothetical protein [Undibacterium umbellatum]MBC3906240.1 hypothetical protein [Undibacterium umbellatum]
MLTFDEDSHTYRWHNQVVPSVTQILAPMLDYSNVPAENLRRAQLLGTYVHKTTELYDLNDLDFDTLPDEIAPYLNAWIKFKRECEFEPATVEQKLYHKQLGYSGTSDRTGLIRGRMAVIDIKKMLSLGPVIGMQLAAYKELHTHAGQKVLDRYALGLRSDGTYRMVPYKDESDYAAFMSLLTLRNWRLKHGIA